MGCDARPCLLSISPVSFNSRTPCGVRPNSKLLFVVSAPFQFTHPVWGATDLSGTKVSRLKFQFTHPVWGATSRSPSLRLLWLVFQFTHPVWGATSALLSALGPQLVSIHAPRAGCDEGDESGDRDRFNSRTPCGVRLVRGRLGAGAYTFQFTHPVRGATSLLLCCFIVLVPFQFTHPVRGATCRRSVC